MNGASDAAYVRGMNLHRAALAAIPAVTITVTAAGLLAGCSGTAPAALPACSTGHGGAQTATLTIRQDGAQFTGVYLTPVSSGADLRYTVAGTASGGHLTSTWTAGSITLPVTGTYTARSITLDNPGGQFAITRFTQATSCPPS